MIQIMEEAGCERGPIGDEKSPAGAGLKLNSPTAVVVGSERAGGTEASLWPRGGAAGSWGAPQE